MSLAHALAIATTTASGDRRHDICRDHAIVSDVSDDDRAVMERLAALEAEVKADADAQRVRKEAALAKVRDERAKQLQERDELRQRQAQLVSRKPREESRPRQDEEFEIGRAHV